MTPTGTTMREGGERVRATTRPLRRIARRVTGVVALAVIVAATVTIALVVYGALTRSWRLVPVRSGSMAPTAPKGSAVIAEPQRASSLRVGDVVLFHAPTEHQPLVVHRIHEIVVRDGEHLYRTKGDANRTPDPWLIRMQSTTVWRVHHVVPFVGNVVDAADDPAVRFGGLTFAVGVILWLGFMRIWRRDRAGAGAAPDATAAAGTAGRAAMAAQAAAVATASLNATTSAGPEGDDAGAHAGPTGHVSSA